MTRDKIKELDYNELRIYDFIPTEQFEILKPILDGIDFDKAESDESAYLIYPTISRIANHIINQDDSITPFGNFDNPELKDKALAKIDVNTIIGKLDTAMKNVMPGLKEFVNLDPEAEICRLVSWYIALDILKETKLNL